MLDRAGRIEGKPLHRFRLAGTFSSWTRLTTLMAIAARLDLVEEEIELLHRQAVRMERCGGLQDHHAARLKLLEERIAKR